VVKRFHKDKWHYQATEQLNLHKVEQLGAMVTHVVAEVGHTLILQPVGDHFVTSTHGEVRRPCLILIIEMLAIDYWTLGCPGR
jgi:hypothetical protein